MKKSPVALIFVVLMAGVPTPTVGTPMQRGIPQIDKSSEKQAGRQALIRQLIDKGIFQKVEVPPGARKPRVWVRPVFYALNFNEKQQFISVVYARYFDGTNTLDSVLIFDALSGDRVGDYSPNLGLKMR